MKTAKVRWQAEEIIGDYRVYARMSRSEIVVRIEFKDDKMKWTEWGMPKAMGLRAAMHQAAVQTAPEDLRP